MEISLKKKYRTRDGKDVKLLLINGGGTHEVVGAYFIPKDLNIWLPCSWTKEGAYYKIGQAAALDLVEIRPKHKQWFVLREWQGFEDKKAAIMAAKSRTLVDVPMSVVQITWEEGEGLEDD